MFLRYKLHTYLYTLVHLASLNGKPIFRPLFYDYPEDPRAYNDVHENGMLGDAIKFSPIYYYASSERRISIYFPGSHEDYWCPLEPYEIVACFKGGEN